MTSRSMAGAVHGSRTSRISRPTIPMPRWCAWNRTIARPAISCTAANAVIANNPDPAGQAAVDRGRRGRTDPRLRRLQRGRRGALRDRPYPQCHRAGQPPHRVRDPVPHHRTVAAVRGVAAAGRHPVSRLRRPALLRARRDQGRAGLSAPGVQSPRRPVVRARGQSAAARYRPTHPGRGARACARFRLLPVAGGRRSVARWRHGGTRGQCPARFLRI